VAYRAEIEIGVKGVQELTKLQKRLEGTAYKVDEINSKQAKVFGGLAQSINNYSRQLALADKALSGVAAGTAQEARAVSNYVSAMGNMNAARERQNKLIQDEINIRQRGALLGQSSPVAGKIQRDKDIQSDRLKLERALLDLEKKSAAELSKKVQLQENLVKGTREVLELAAEAQRKQQFRAGKSGSTQLGPLAGPGAFGFPVALPLTAAEQKGLEIAAKKQQILQRTVKTRQDLVGLAANLQRLETRTTVAIADAKREQQQLNDQKQRALQLSERQLQISKQGARLAGRFNDIRGAENIPGSPKFIEAQARRRKEALGSGIIGGAFPLLFGQGIGAAAGGGVGGAAGGLVGGQFGFGLSLVGTALGSSFDALAKSAAELGAALDSVTGDASAVAKAAGLTGTDLGRLIENLEQAGDKTQAMALATQELEEIVGKQGVKALRDFSATTEQMGRDLEALATRIKALFAGIANVVFPPETTKRLEETKAIERARRSNDPKVQQAVRDYFDQSNFENLGLKEGVDARLAARQKILDLVKQQQDEMLRIRSLTEDVAQKEREKTAEQETSLSIAKARLIAEQNNGDILNATVEASLRAIAAEETRLELVKAAGDARLIELALINAATKKAEIDNQILAAREALSRKAARAERKAPESKALSLQRQIAQERLNVAEIENKILNIGQDRLYVALEEARQIETRKNAQIQALEYARQDALNRNKVKGDEALINELYDARLLKIRNIAELASAENDVLIERIALERELAKLAGERETEDIGIGLNRQIGAVERRISSPFGGQDSEMLELRIKQVQRQEDAYRALDRQIDDVNKKLEKDESNKILQDELLLLEGRKLKYKELLPVLDQVEQKELQMQQTLQKLQPLTNALSQGLTDLFTGLIDGSKDAQEVFADMLKSMGQALIQQGAVMIAQYIAIGIARLFALGGSRVGPENFNLQGFGPLAPTPGAAFAEGGFVTGPTRALVGEGGQPEYIIPEDKMRESLERYSRGARGSAVIPQNGDTVSTGTGNTAVASKPIDVRYTVERINNVEYVTADQFQAGMKQAAQQGAMQGERRALTTLKQNTTQRRRIGL